MANIKKWYYLGWNHLYRYFINFGCCLFIRSFYVWNYFKQKEKI